MCYYVIISDVQHLVTELMEDDLHSTIQQHLIINSTSTVTQQMYTWCNHIHVEPPLQLPFVENMMGKRWGDGGGWRKRGMEG